MSHASLMFRHPRIAGRLKYVLALSASLFLLSPVEAAVLPFTGATFSPPGTTFDDTAFLTSYSTSAGTVTALSHAVSAQGRFNKAGGGSEVDNVFGVVGGEVDGVIATLNLDVSVGVINAGDSDALPENSTDVGATGSNMAQFFFSQEITSGIAGNGNDFFLVELNGNDTITLVPLDAAGNQIGAFSLPIAAGGANWGGLGAGVDRIIQSLPGNTGVSPLAGVAFDLEDFDDGLGGTLAGLHGIGWSGTAGLDAMVVGVNKVLAPAPSLPAAEPVLHVNRNTGAITLENAGLLDLEFRGYSITSAAGALDSDNWVSIAGNYDVMPGGDGTVDDDDAWTPLTASGSSTDLSEFQFGGTPGDGGTLGAGQTIALSQGAGAWVPWFTETDLLMNLTLADGSITQLPVPVVYEGNGDVPLLRSDFNQDGDITEADWAILRNNNPSDLSSLSTVHAYVLGDVDLDGDNDIHDFDLFVSDFESLNGTGSFAAMLQSVPEPSSLLLLSVALGAVLSLGRRKRISSLAAVALSASLFLLSPVEAAVLPFTGATFSPPGTTFDDTAFLTSYSTSAGTVTALSHAVSAQGRFNKAGDGSEVDNVFGVVGGEVDGVIATLNLDISVGVINAGDSDALPENSTDVGATGSNMAQFFFSQEITSGIAGNGNDFFLVELNGNDTITLVPLDAAGNQIGAFSLPIAAGGANWGGLGAGVDRIIQSLPGNTGVSPLAGVAFDFEDFDDGLGGTLAGLHGIGWSGTAGLDAMVVGVNEGLAPASLLKFTAVIQPITGEIQLVNLSEDPITFNSYELASMTLDTLNPAGWNSLSTQNLDQVDDGADLGETWDEGGASDASAMSEQFLLGNTTLAPGDAVTLGTIYDTSADGKISFEYRDDDENLIKGGLVRTVLLGDMDGNGTLEEADINPFVQALTDRAGYLSSNLGVVSADMVGDFNGNGRLDLGDISGFKSAIAALGTASATANAVPEPSTVMLLFSSLIPLFLNRRRNG